MNLPLFLEPRDEHNERLLQNVHPTSWQNPISQGRYNLVVIGAGTAGLVTAAGAAGLGAKVALIERGSMGGDCLNVGCVPSKALIGAARSIAEAKRAIAYGIKSDNQTVDFERIMERMRRLRSSMSHHDSAERFMSLGVDVFFGQGSFVDNQTIEVDGQRLQFKSAVIASGARAAPTDVPGLAELGYLTNETVFSLTKLPKKLIVIGAGPIGTELAQCFATFGAAVTILERSSRILPREEEDAATIVHQSLVDEGVTILVNSTAIRAESIDGVKSMLVRQNGNELRLEWDAVLLGVGRVPNLDGLDLENADVEFTDAGVTVDDSLRTSNSKIFAAGDICSQYKFTHAADFMARIVIQNSLFLGRARMSKLLIPWCTYTSPEIAHVGMTHSELQSHIDIRSFTQPFTAVDRAILDGQTNGYARVYCSKKSDQILGATIVAANAGDMIGELVMAMKNKIGLKKIASIIHPYPTQAEAIRKLGDQFNRTRLSPTVKSLMGKWLKWTR